MLFNSSLYIFVFLPAVLLVYFQLCRHGPSTVGRVWLLLASLFFYGYWNPIYIPLILVSIVVNFAVGQLILRPGLARLRKVCLTLGIMFNLGLLGYYKYADFFLSSINYLVDEPFDLLGLVLPLAISFFTFQQIAYLVDTYKGHTRDYGFINYSLFVCFFPQLIAGPIVHHRKLVPQFLKVKTASPVVENITTGLYIFALGLFKKVILADGYAQWANIGHANPASLGFVESWVTSLSFTLQLYFDFSGYSDMAIGAALMFNIRLPNNFNSPFKSADIRDFWRRWHITLGDFIIRYVYGPLGSRKKGRARQYLNLFISFFAVGIWHGAGWTFVVFGLMHGGVVALHQIWRDVGLKMPAWLGVVLTFHFVNISCVLFRADSLLSASQIFQGMLGLNGLVSAESIRAFNRFFGNEAVGPLGLLFDYSQRNVEELCIFAVSLGFFLLGFLIISLLPNSTQMVFDKACPAVFRFRITRGWCLITGLVLGCALTGVVVEAGSEFLYFGF